MEENIQGGQGFSKPVTYLPTDSTIAVMVARTDAVHAAAWMLIFPQGNISSFFCGEIYHLGISRMCVTPKAMYLC
jgi:hypothetical protein